MADRKQTPRKTAKERSEAYRLDAKRRLDAAQQNAGATDAKTDELVRKSIKEEGV